MKNLDIFHNIRELGNYSNLISDDEIRQILIKFSPILHKGILESGSFFMRSANRSLTSAVLMTNEELALWQRYHRVIDNTTEEIRKGRLFVPEIDSPDQSRLDTTFNSDYYKNESQQLSLRTGHGSRNYRVNLDEVINVPIGLFDGQDAQFLVKPHAHLGGQSGGHKSLYNAFIGLHTFVQDQFGRWVVDAIGGTTPNVDAPNWVDGPVYSPYMPARSSLWFNTSIDESKENVLSVTGKGQFDTMFHCEIHNPNKLNQLRVPNDGQLRFFFWQLNSFINNGGLFLLESGD
jgi:hypothetical protein